VNFLLEQIKRATDWLQKTTTSGFNWIYEQIKKATDWIRRSISSGINWIYEQIKKATSWLQKTTTSGFNWIYDQIKKSTDWLRRSISSGINSIYNQIRKVADWLQKTTTSGFNWIYNKLVSDVRFISGKLGDTARWMKDQVWNAARWIRDGVAGGVYSVFGEFMTSFSNWIKTLWTTVLEFLQERFLGPILRAMRWLTDKIEDLIKASWQHAIETIHHFSPIRPEQAPQLGGVFFAFATGTGMAAHGIAQAVQVIPILRGVPLQYLAGFLGEMAGWGRITGATLGVLTAYAVGTPFRYYVNSVVRPWLPEKREIMELYSRGRISTKEWRRLMSYYGLADDYLDILDELKNTPLSAFLLPRMAAAGALTIPEAAEEAKRRGYSEKTQQAIIRWVEMEKYGETRPIASGAAIGLYKEGWIGVEKFSEYMKGLGCPDTLLPKYRFAAYLSFIYDYLTDLLSAAKEAYRKGIISDQEFMDILIGRGMDKERAKIHLYREQIRRYGKTA